MAAACITPQLETHCSLPFCPRLRIGVSPCIDWGSQDGVCLCASVALLLQ